MQTNDKITKVTQLIQRADGSEAKIVATQMFGAGLTPSIDVYVLRRANSNAAWSLCSDRPADGWKTMSRSDYIAHGRSEMLRTVTTGELLKVTSLLGQPMNSCH